MQSFRPPRLARLAGVCGIAAALAATQASGGDAAADLAPLPAAAPLKAEQVELGKHLFFDTRLSGDWGVSCASCHDPEKGWGDGQALSNGYPSTLYFRNAPTLLNSKHRNVLMWDGRLDGADLGTLVRDMITEAHTMNMDGRLLQERLKQMPGYMAMWEQAFGPGTDPYGPATFNVIAEFVKSLESENVPFDRFKQGDASALSEEAQRGYALFTGKAGCVACHNGPIGSDGAVHKTGVPENPEVMSEPLRSISLLRHYATSGMPNYMNARGDLGHYCISKAPADRGKFATPGLRELKYTAPYMHNGVFATLAEVIDFYDQGGGEGAELQPLGLSAQQKQDLETFLLTLSGDPIVVAAPEFPELDVRTFGKN